MILLALLISCCTASYTACVNKNCSAAAREFNDVPTNITIGYAYANVYYGDSPCRQPGSIIFCLDIELKDYDVELTYIWVGMDLSSMPLYVQHYPYRCEFRGGGRKCRASIPLSCACGYTNCPCGKKVYYSALIGYTDSENRGMSWLGGKKYVTTSVLCDNECSC